MSAPRVAVAAAVAAAVVVVAVIATTAVNQVTSLVTAPNRDKAAEAAENWEGKPLRFQEHSASRPSRKGRGCFFVD